MVRPSASKGDQVTHELALVFRHSSHCTCFVLANPALALRIYVCLCVCPRGCIAETRDEDPDPVIFGTPDPVLFSTDPDPDPDPTCNNGFIKLFSS